MKNKIQELEKGCGKSYDWEQNIYTEDSDKPIIHQYGRCREGNLCPICKTKIKAKKETDEKIEKLRWIIQDLHLKGYCSPIYLNEEIDKIFKNEVEDE